MADSDNLTTSEHSTPTSEHTGSPAISPQHHHHHPIANLYPAHQLSHHYQSHQKLNQWLQKAQMQASTQMAPATTTACTITHQTPLHKPKEKDNNYGQPNPANTSTQLPPHHGQKHQYNQH